MGIWAQVLVRCVMPAGMLELLQPASVANCKDSLCALKACIPTLSPATVLTECSSLICSPKIQDLAILYTCSAVQAAPVACGGCQRSHYSASTRLVNSCKSYLQGLSEEDVQAAARTAAADAAQASDLVNRTSGAADAQERCAFAQHQSCPVWPSMKLQWGAV